MSKRQHYEILVIGSGEAGKYLAWTMAKAGKRTEVAERAYIGGSCPNIACLPSKNIIHSAKVAELIERAPEFGVTTGPVGIDMAGVRQRKRKMVDELIAIHLDRYKQSGAELIMGEARLTSATTVKVCSKDGTRTELEADRIFPNVGTHAATPDIPGLKEAKRQASIPGFARRNLRSPHDGGGAQRAVCCSARRARKNFERSCSLRMSL